MKMMRWIVGAFLAAFLPWSAIAQVQQSGTVTAGHAAKWVASGIIGDAGTSATGGLNTLGIQSSSSQSFGINNAAPSGAHNRLTLGISSTQGTIGIQAYNGATALPLFFNIQGTSFNVLDGRSGTAINEQTGTTYTVLSSDQGKWVTFTSGSSIAVTVPDASGASFATPFTTTLVVTGAGTATATPAAGTICGAATLTVPPGTYVQLISDSTNWICNWTPGTLSTLDTVGTSQIDNSAVTNAKLANASNLTIKSNVSGGSAAPSDNTITQVMDAVFTNTRGTIIYRGSGTWTYLTPGTSGKFLKTRGVGADPTWASEVGTGTVTSVATGTGLTGGTITTTGTISLASVSDGTILSNVSGGSAAPSANTLTQVLDATLTNTRGSVMYRGSGLWEYLTPGASGTVLTTLGAGANPTWGVIAGTGTVTSVAMTGGTTGITTTGGPITASGTFTLGGTLAVANGGTGSTTPISGIDQTLNTSSALVVKYVTAATVDIDATQLIIYNSVGTWLASNNVNLTVDITASGANGLDTGAEASSTWYYIWVIGKPDGTVAGLFSISSTAPTLPAGYSFKGLIGAVYNNGSSNFATFYQTGKRVIIVGTAVVSAGTATSFTSVDLSAAIPPNAKIAVIQAFLSSSSGAVQVSAFVAPAGSGTTPTYGLFQASFLLTAGVSTANLFYPDIPLSTAQTIYYYTVANASIYLYASGWSY